MSREQVRRREQFYDEWIGLLFRVCGDFRDESDTELNIVNIEWSDDNIDDDATVGRASSIFLNTKP